MKDWIGNQKSIYTTIGASNHTEKERETNDYYATDPKAIDYLLEKAIIPKDIPIWECAAGEGHLSKRLIELGYKVYSTDLIDRGFSGGGVQTSSNRMNTGMVTFLQTHHTNMLLSLSSMLWNLFQMETVSLCFLS